MRQIIDALNYIDANPEVKDVDAVLKAVNADFTNTPSYLIDKTHNCLRTYIDHRLKAGVDGDMTAFYNYAATWLEPATLPYLKWLLLTEGLYVCNACGSGTPTTLSNMQARKQQTIDDMLSGCEIDDVPLYREDMSLEEAVSALAKYLLAYSSHGEMIGSAIWDHTVWQHAANAELMHVVLNHVIRIAADSGVDH